MYGDLSELERVIDSQLSKGSGSWYCKSCDYSHLRKDVVRNHIEVNHVTSGGFECHVCSKVCPTRKALNMHKYRNKHF